MKKLQLLIIASVLSVLSNAQVPKYDTGIIHTNAVSALYTSDGSQNSKSSGGPAYYVPYPGIVSSIFCGALWVGGLDAGRHLHIAAQTYHKKGTDFWPGPVMDSLSYSTHQDTVWNHVWVIYKSTIDSFRAGKFGSTIPASIKNWPGDGNTAIGEMATLAPYADSGHSGYYDPSKGDYPLIRGDEALYSIFNDDRGISHTETGGKKLGIEVHLMVYQFNSTDTAINETTFMHYDIYNLSKNDYDSIYLGNWVDMDVGNGGDNYIGCDSANNYWYTYDAHKYNANGSGMFSDEPGYGNAPPAQSLAYLCDTMTHFMNYNNDSTKQGNPTGAGWYYNYMKNLWGDSTHTTYGGNGYKSSLTNTNYTYSGNPEGITGWSESGDKNPSGERVGISSVGPFTFKSGTRKSLDLALVFSQGLSGMGNIYPALLLGPRINDVRSFYNSQSYGCDEDLLGVPKIISNGTVYGVSIYPNPTHGIFTIAPSGVTGKLSVEIYNVLGERIYSKTFNSARDENSINISAASPGVYFYRVLSENGNLIGDGKVVKQ